MRTTRRAWPSSKASPSEIQKILMRLDEAEDADMEASRADGASERALYETPRRRTRAPCGCSATSPTSSTKTTWSMTFTSATSWATPSAMQSRFWSGRRGHEHRPTTTPPLRRSSSNSAPACARRSPTQWRRSRTCWTRSTPTPILRKTIRRKTTRHARTWATMSRALGAPGTFYFPDQTHWADGADDDREDESELLEPGGDEEPALGATMASISSTPGGRMWTPGAHATKRSLRSAGRATAAAILKWRCAAMTTIASTMTSARKITTSRRSTADDRRDQQLKFWRRTSERRSIFRARCGC